MRGRGGVLKKTNVLWGGEGAVLENKQGGMREEGGSKPGNLEQTYFLNVSYSTTHSTTTRKKMKKVLFSILKISLSLYTILKPLLS